VSFCDAHNFRNKSAELRFVFDAPGACAAQHRAALLPLSPQPNDTKKKEILLAFWEVELKSPECWPLCYFFFLNYKSFGKDAILVDMYPIIHFGGL